MPQETFDSVREPRASSAKPFEIRQLQPAIGAVVENVDLSRALEDHEKAVLRDTLLRHGVIFLRQQPIDEGQFVSLGQLFGKVAGHDDDPDRPRVGYQMSAAGAKDQAANVWHSDGCYLASPPAITILRAIQASPLGGDTCFSSAVAAYAGLSDEMKQRIRSLRYRSSFAFIISRYPRFTDPKILEEQAKRYPEVEQPVVRVHPETGAHVLYTNDSQTMDIVGLDNVQSAALLRDLSDEIKRPEYQVRWTWSDGDIAIWDNRAVQHYGVPDHTGDRRMSRISIEGEPAIGA